MDEAIYLGHVDRRTRAIQRAFRNKGYALSVIAYPGHTKQELPTEMWAPYQEFLRNVQLYEQAVLLISPKGIPQRSYRVSAADPNVVEDAPSTFPMLWDGPTNDAAEQVRRDVVEGVLREQWAAFKTLCAAIRDNAYARQFMDEADSSAFYNGLLRMESTRF